MKKAAERPVWLRIQISISPPKGAFRAEVRSLATIPVQVSSGLPKPPKIVEVSPRGGEELHTAVVSLIF